MSVSWLDVKLGLRMLVKYPGLSLVAVIGMAVAIAIGAGSFAATYAMVDPTLPLDEGDRVVAIQNNRADNPGNPDRTALHDFVVWRDELKSVRDLTALRMDRRNLVAADGSTELVRIAEMTASGFRVARVAPVLGRPLIDEDERPGASPVIVIAYEEWQRRFDGDPDIVGRSIRLGNTVHTVIGVMPEGFRFPVQHRYWLPLRLDEGRPTSVRAASQGVGAAVGRGELGRYGDRHTGRSGRLMHDRRSWRRWARVFRRIIGR